MSNQSGGPSGPGRFFASIYEAINSCNLEQFDAIVVAMFFFVGGGLLIGAIFLANLVGYFTPITKTAVHAPHYQQQTQINAAAPVHPAYVQPFAQHAYHPSVASHPHYQVHPYAVPVQAYPAHAPQFSQAQAYPGLAQSYPAHTYAAPAQTYPAPVIGTNWSTTPQHFGRPRSSSHGWYPFADARFGQAEASNQPPM